MITDEMVERAAIKAWMTVHAGHKAESDWQYFDEIEKVSYKREARAVLEYAAALDPTREARLVQYRRSVLSGQAQNVNEWMDRWIKNGVAADEQGFEAWLGEEVERRAHAMLAAERPADAVERDESGDAAPVLRKALALALRALHAPHDDDLRRKTIEAISPTVDPEPMPGSLSDQVAAYLAAGNESTVAYIAEHLCSNSVDVRDALLDLQAVGEADIVSGTARWAKVPR